jgi:hypothetical protein
MGNCREYKRTAAAVHDCGIYAQSVQTVEQTLEALVALIPAEAAVKTGARSGSGRSGVEAMLISGQDMWCESVLPLGINGESFQEECGELHRIQPAP